MKKKHLIIGLVIVVLSFYYAFKNVSLEELANAFKTVNYVYLVPSVLLVALTFIFRAMRWRYLVSSVKDVKTSHLASPLMVGFMGNILPARAGELIRAYLLSKKENVSFSASFATIFVERLMDMLMFLLMLVWVLFFGVGKLSQGNVESNQQLIGYLTKFGWISFIGSLGIFSFIFLLQYKNELAIKIVEFFTKPFPDKWRYKLVSMVHSFTDGLKILKDVRGFMASILLSFLVWIPMTAVYYALNVAFGLENQLPMITATVITSLIIGIFISLFPTPGFLGAFQAACVFSLHNVFGVSKPVAASYGIIAWLVAMGFIIIVGLFFVLKDNISFSELKTVSEEAE